MPPLFPDIDTLSLAQQVAQMVVVRASGYLFDPQIQYPIWEPVTKTLHHWISDVGVGGVILLGGSAAEVALRTHQLQEWATIPLLIAADIEEGVGQRFSGATWFPPPMALDKIADEPNSRAEAYARQMGEIIAREAQAIGLNWVLAPVVDVNNNPDNPVINVRAFGDRPARVSQLTTAFIQGAQRYPVLTTAKHFPGHGDTAVDSHLDLPVLPHSQTRLATIELPPFKAAIAAGVDGVMSAHLKIPTLDPTYPATLSHRILTQELRHALGFDGLIVTDALVMGAIADRYGANEAAVLAVEAGADILLMPLDPVGAVGAVCAAVEADRISPERIRASVERIWQAKQKGCAPIMQLDTSSSPSHAWESSTGVTTDSVTSRLAQPDAIALVDDILRDSMQIHTSVSTGLAQLTAENPCNLIVVDDALDCDFLNRNSPAIAMPQLQAYRPYVVDRYTPNLLPPLTAWQPTLLQLFIRGNPFRGSAGLTETAQQWFQFLVQSNQLRALIIYGSPYMLEKFLSDLPPDIPYVFTYGQMEAAQTIALNTLFNQS